MIPVYEPAVVRETERRAVEAAEAAGGHDALMVVAARAVADAALAMTGVGSTVVALVGGGDNGGDALYATAALAASGRRVRAALVTDHPHARALAAARRAGVDVRDLAPAGAAEPPVWLAADVWIDGITGSGLTGPLREPLAAMVAALNARAHRCGTAVLAIDLPTGLGGTDGRVEGPVLDAARTVTMGAMKTPLALPPAAAHAGAITVADLGIAPEGDPAVLRPEAADVAAALHVPGPFDHKYTRGVVAVAAGSDTYPGAGLLCASGAVAAGPGMVRIASSRRVVDMVLQRHPSVVAARGRAQAAVVGSGLDAGVEPMARAVVQRALEAGHPLVVDAGALESLSDLMRAAGPLTQVVLTPHAGEAAAALTELGGRAVARDEVEADPLRAARRLVELTGATVVLKGAVTLVAAADGRVLSVAGTTGWTGVAGSGDVLAGVIGALLAQGRAAQERTGAPMDHAASAAAAVWLHARAARLAVEQAAAGPAGGRPGPRSPQGAPIQPDEIAAHIPAAVAEALEAAEARAQADRHASWEATGGSPS